MFDQRMAGLKSEQFPLLARLARVPETIRGFGHVKELAVAEYRVRKQALLSGNIKKRAA